MKRKLNPNEFSKNLTVYHLNFLLKSSLIKEYGISSILTELIIKNRPFENAEQILNLVTEYKDGDISEINHLFKLVSPFMENFCSIISKKSVSFEKDSYIYGYLKSDNKNSIWIFINLPNINLISARIENDKINYNTINFFGKHYLNLPSDLKEQKRCIEVLHSPIAVKIIDLLDVDMTNIPINISNALKELVKILRYTQGLIWPRYNPILSPIEMIMKIEKGDISYDDFLMKGFIGEIPKRKTQKIKKLKSGRIKKMVKLNKAKNPIFKKEYEHFKNYPLLFSALKKDLMVFYPGLEGKYKKSSNGCGTGWTATVVPDGWWRECCDEHDYCYGRGGDELDRFNCDNAFLVCLLSKFCPLAHFYYSAVQAGGWVAFSYTDDEEEGEDEGEEEELLQDFEEEDDDLSIHYALNVSMP